MKTRQLVRSIRNIVVNTTKTYPKIPLFHTIRLNLYFKGENTMSIKKSYMILWILTIFVFSSCEETVQNKVVSAPKSINNQPQTTKTVQTKDSNNLASILQHIIDLPSLQKYYHVEKLASRKPLIILKNETLVNEITLTKFNEPVVFSSCKKIKENNKPYLEFVKINIKENAADVVFRYRVEGLEGRITLEKEENNWKVKKQELVESKFSDKGCKK